MLLILRTGYQLYAVDNAGSNVSVRGQQQCQDVVYWNFCMCDFSRANKLRIRPNVKLDFLQIIHKNAVVIINVVPTNVVFLVLLLWIQV